MWSELLTRVGEKNAKRSRVHIFFGRKVMRVIKKKVDFWVSEKLAIKYLRHLMVLRDGGSSLEAIYFHLFAAGQFIRSLECKNGKDHLWEIFVRDIKARIERGGERNGDRKQRVIFVMASRSSCQLYGAETIPLFNSPDPGQGSKLEVFVSHYIFTHEASSILASSTRTKTHREPQQLSRECCRQDEGSAGGSFRP